MEKARAGYDRTHRIIGTLNYELPFGQGKKWFASGWKKIAFGGFELSWIQTQESGNPITFGFANSPFNYWPGFAGNGRPDLISPIEIRNGWYDLGGDRFTKVAKPKHVLVIGGGPAGLEAARAAAERGNRVTLLEASDKLGGQFRLAGYGLVTEVTSIQIHCR